MHRIPLLLSVLLLGLPVTATAQEETSHGYSGPGYTSDVAGEDHALVSRYQGSMIYGYFPTRYDTYAFPVGPVDDGEASSAKTLEGDLTTIVYRGPESRSTLEVFRNYQGALAEAGFESVWECSGSDCGAYFQDAVTGATGEPHLAVSSSDQATQRFVAARHRSGGAWVTVYVGEGWNEMGIPFTRVDVLEMEEMDTGLVRVDADAMKDALDATGKVAIYDLYFDTGSSQLKAESAGALGEIAALLARHPDLRLHVVGHTDATGGIASNMALSRDRAASVVEALTGRHGVGADRLDPHGVGPLAPVASNGDEDGRAKNRRVELVVRRSDGQARGAPPSALTSPAAGPPA